MKIYEKFVRGGVSTVLVNRYVKCNNKDTNENFDYWYEPGQNEFGKLIIDFNEDKSRNLSKTEKQNYMFYYDASSLYLIKMVLCFTNKRNDVGKCLFSLPR